MIDIGHPAHVHFFKNTIFELKKKDHQVLVTAMDKEVTIELLKSYGIEHIVVGKKGKSTSNLLSQWVMRDLKILKIAYKFNPDILMGISNPCIAHSAWILRKKSIVFDDTEHASFAHKVTYPFANVICTPPCFQNDIGKKQIRYNGYHELAYLHPNYFTPNPEVLNELGLAEGDPFIILRFVSWGASHDIGHHGIQNKLEFVKELEKYGRVLITSEADLGPEFEKYKIKVSPEKLHDLLYYATLFLGESPTMTTESAILGTPAVCISSWACNCGNFEDLSSKYGLIYCYKDEKEAISKGIELLNANAKKKWLAKRNNLLSEKIDVTKFMVDLIEDCRIDK
ncbi:MAG: DUF354 domain-containing protein [Thermodesulfobacteriota bacterium]|nr:DUF354 domain-containing protein [Thermodesulfobacteriota bacterium]